MNEFKLSKNRNNVYPYVESRALLPQSLFTIIPLELLAENTFSYLEVIDKSLYVKILCELIPIGDLI